MKYSIIIPVYNTKSDYLEECINSILNQTYKNYEIIIVDDGSNRETKEFLKKYIDDNIYVYNNENHGVSYSRNFGVSKASGEYVIFVDSDDMISPYFLQIATEILKERKYDLLLSNITFDKSLINNESYNFINLSSDKIKLLKYYLSFSDKDFKKNNYWLNRGPVTRVLKREVALVNTFDEEEKFAEDVLWNIKLLEKIQKIGYIDAVIYYYRKNDQSTTASYHKDFDKVLKNVVKKIRNSIPNNVLEDYWYATYEYYTIYLKLDLFHKQNSLSKLEKIDKLKEKNKIMINDFHLKELKYKKFNLKKKILLFLLKHKFYKIIFYIESR